MGQVKCSERFLRACLWAVKDLPENEQVEICLRRACQKLRLSTREGCFTDPNVTAKYIERCYGKEAWDAIHKEVSEANAVGDVKMLFEQFAFGSTLPQDITYLNQVFCVDSETKKYRHTEVEPKLYKHGRRAASGLRNTYVCRASRNWVMAEYTAYCNDCTRGNVPVDAPYVWLSKEIARFKEDPQAQAVYTEFNNGTPAPVSAEVSDYMGQIKNHYTYMAGLYDILCHLVTLRIMPDFNIEWANAAWHNVWYFGTELFPVQRSFLNQFASLNVLEVIYLEIAKSLAPVRKQREYRLTYSVTNKVDEKILANETVTRLLVDGLHKRDFKFGCEMLSVIMSNENLMTEIFGGKSASERKELFRKTLRPYCYCDFKVSNLSDFKVCSKHNSDISEYVLNYPSLKKVLGVTSLESEVSYDGRVSGVATHNYLYMNDCLSGVSMTNAIEVAQPTTKIKIIYVGTGDGPRILSGNGTKEDLLKANLEILDYETLKFVPITDEAFYESSTVISGTARDILAKASLSEVKLSSAKKTSYLQQDFIMSWHLIYTALQQLREEVESEEFAHSAGENAQLIRMDDPFLFDRKNSWHDTPYPMLAHYSKLNTSVPAGATLPLTAVSLRPVYVMTKNLDSYYGLTSFGGVEIITDIDTDKALVLKKDLFLTALGLSDECIEKLCQAMEEYRNPQTAVSYLSSDPMYKDAVRTVKESLSIHNLQIAPVSLYNLRTHTMQDIIKAADKVTWSQSGIWEIKRLVFRESKTEE